MKIFRKPISRRMLRQKCVGLFILAIAEGLVYAGLRFGEADFTAAILLGVVGAAVALTDKYILVEKVVSK